MYVQQLKQAQENQQKYTKRQPWLTIWSFMIGSFSISCYDFFTSLILTICETLVEYRLITHACLPKALPVFQPYSFSSSSLYSAYVLLKVSSQALSTLYCFHFCLPPNKYTLPLLIAPFKTFSFPMRLITLFWCINSICKKLILVYYTFYICHHLYYWLISPPYDQ